MDIEKRNFYISIIAALSLTMVFTAIPVWQLVIIPGIIAGLLNKSMKYAMLSGLIGVVLAWVIYISVGLITREIYTILNQFGLLLFGPGFGWLLLVLIIILGALFGALGGGIGNGLLIIYKFYFEKPLRNEQ